MTLHDALGGMRDIPQWFLWRLEWDAAEGKYQKTPCALDGSVYRIDASKPESWNAYEVVRARQAALDAPGGALRYALGFWITPAAGYWLLDIDKCAANGVLTEHAQGMLNAFAGCLVEWSSSGRGVHIIGRSRICAPEHRSRDIHKLHMELYTEQRGIAFGLDGRAAGSADWDADALLVQLVEQYFPRAESIGPTVGARPEWRGPTDDDVLIQRMLNAKSSAAVAFGGKLSVGQLWRGEVHEDERSNADMALACHLAFWTGCDEERMVRLMKRSGLAREKWTVHRTYLRELTVRNAIAQCREVYQEPERDARPAQQMYGPLVTTQLAPSQSVIAPEVAARVRELLDMVSACGTVEDMHNQVIPAIQGAGVPGAYQEQIVRVVNEQLDVWKAKLPVGKLRALLFPPALMRADEGEAPLWLQRHCYVKDGDFFYDVETGARMTAQGFIAEYARLMPIKPTGGRENPVEWAFTRWNITTVQSLSYRPDKGPYFEFNGVQHANLYSPSSVPATATAWTEEGLAGIEEFQRLMWDMCARRQEVYEKLLWWMAWNVQRPGHKVRWAPIIKGTQGDGKSLIAAVLRAAMGRRNVAVTSNATLTASGGFTDWAVGGAVNVFEEIHLTGKERHRLYNAMKDYITNDDVNVNAKGGKTYQAYNITNHFAFSNHNDALPLERNDRRWFVIFTPWEGLDEMMRYCGLTADEWAERADRIDRAFRNCAGEFRAWLLGVTIGPSFKPSGSALMTPEKQQMMASSQDDAESVTISLIEQGAHGITKKVLSSSCLSHALKIRAQVEGFEVPRSTALNHMLTRLGFSKLPQQIKWNGSTHTFWVKNGVNLDNEGLRLELSTHLQPNLQP